MTTQQLVDYFGVLQDKYGSPNFLSSEVVSFLNNATNEWLNRLVPDSVGGVVNFEADSNVTSQLRPLIYTFSVNSDSNGLVTDSAINTALSTAVGSGSPTFFRAMNVIYNNTPVKYVKHNNISAYLKNSYKTASTSYHLFTEVAKGFQLYPQSTTTVSMTVIKTPNVLSLTPSVINPELDDYCLYNVLSIALGYAGISTRDDELINDIRSVTSQSAK